MKETKYRRLFCSEQGIRPIFKLMALLMALTVLAMCDDEGTGNGGHPCPKAKVAYDYSQTKFVEIMKAFRFGSRWEVKISGKTVRPASMYDLLDISFNYTGRYEMTSEAVLELHLPPAFENPLECDQLAYLESALSGDELKEAIENMLLMEVLDRLVGVTARGTETVTVYKEADVYKEYKVGFGLFCLYDNPCPNIQETISECPTVSSTYSIEIGYVLEWQPGQKPLFWLDAPDYEPIKGQQRQWDGNLPTDFEFTIVDPNDPCANQIPICVGRDSQPSDWCPDLKGSCCSAEQVPFKNGTHQLTSDDGEFTETFTLRCVDGCDCIAPAECDDEKECTTDECKGGNCVNTPDDSIKPKQVDGDCRRCESGEVISVRKQFDKTCEDIINDTILTCNVKGIGAEEWIVDWEFRYNEVPEFGHLCSSPQTSGTKIYQICTGKGNCSSGVPVTTLEGVEDETCINYDGQENHFLCQVNCTICNP